MAAVLLLVAPHGLALSFVLGAAPADAEVAAPPPRVEARPRGGRMLPGLRRYLTRDLQYSARHLDHGVLSAAVAGGYPHRYRLALSMGFLDHITLGLTGHWLPAQRVPQWSPFAALAFWRGRNFEAGVTYHQEMYPPPPRDGDTRTPSFQEIDHWLLTSASFSNAWLSGGFDLGAVRAIEKDPGMDANDMRENPSIVRWRVGGGLHLRAGTRRWGFTINALAPRLAAELVFDVRFGLFEARPRGGWRPHGVVYSTDRRAPRWR